jgi:hypothetical protein
MHSLSVGEFTRIALEDLTVNKDPRKAVAKL